MTIGGEGGLLYYYVLYDLSFFLYVYFTGAAAADSLLVFLVFLTWMECT